MGTEHHAKPRVCHEYAAGDADEFFHARPWLVFGVLSKEETLGLTRHYLTRAARKADRRVCA